MPHAAVIEASVRVTVAIPAYNAARTLTDTVASVRQQTHANLEIFIVDDGSTDDTLALAQEQAKADPRITIIQKPNGGVSSARNAALAAATGLYFAAVDADDLCHFDKIGRQVSLMEQSGPETVLCYSWFAYVDTDSRIISLAQPSEEGDVIARMSCGNLVGNASSPLMRTDVLRAAGGWDETMRQGNEDYDIYFRLAEMGRFAVVKDYMLGYRQARGSMSGNALAMVRSYDLVASRFAPRHPEHQAAFTQGRKDLIAYLFDKAALNSRWRLAWSLFREARAMDRAFSEKLLRGMPAIVVRIMVPLGLRARVQRLRRRQQAKGHFYGAAAGQAS